MASESTLFGHSSIELPKQLGPCPDSCHLGPGKSEHDAHTTRTRQGSTSAAHLGRRTASRQGEQSCAEHRAVERCHSSTNLSRARPFREWRRAERSPRIAYQLPRAALDAYSTSNRAAEARLQVTRHGARRRRRPCASSWRSRYARPPSSDQLRRCCRRSRPSMPHARATRRRPAGLLSDDAPCRRSSRHGLEMVLRGVLVSPEGSAEADPKSARFPAGSVQISTSLSRPKRRRREHLVKPRQSRERRTRDFQLGERSPRNGSAPACLRAKLS